MNLITSWIEALERDSKADSDGLRELNAMTRLNVLPHHLKEMEKGGRAVPVKMQRYILNEIFIDMLFQVIKMDNKLEIARIMQHSIMLPERI